MEIYLILAAVLGIFIAVFAIQNAAPVTVKFLVWQFESSLAVLIIIAILAGMLLVLLISIPGRIKRRKELFDKQRKIRELEKKLKELEKAQTNQSTQEAAK
ncbi:LapA family protein [Thermodesulfatator atlanticus]|uniref:LapA family protein n=1 Tax=Thermodesulfatator atlanticus TaxID=501497 RepID=UPI0003B63A40|nr:LapA family protein [Thermodesulfatator atlanticus]